ncbi:cytochrome P450 71D10-like isoform X4 [Arachis stenosperma]|uniref:cytochrome P450 71D10-like isoform X4 n=1 Tax=Arachis stenosperma TaxID=217475 RepID=UPI0025AB7CB2|nr:cytochrome P450 71D10-like isoform X4 [Arachis stenosperma]
MDLQNLISIFTTFLFLFMLLKIAMKKFSSSKDITNLPPGPRKLPIIGNMHNLVGSMPHECLRNLASKYGPLMHLKLGEVSHIIVTSPEMAQEIMKTQDLNFCDRPNLLFARVMNYNRTAIAFGPYGEYWRRVRKICTTELLTAKRVQSFRHIREAEVSELVKAISQSEGSIFNLSHNILSMTYGIVARIAFALQIGGGNCIADLYPSIRVLLEMMSRDKTKLEELHLKSDKIVQGIIDDHKNKKGGKCEEEADDEDLVDVLLKFQQKDSEYPLTNDNIKAVIQDIFAGGGETSSAVVEWAMAEMIKKPKVMEAAQAEVRRVYGSKRYVDESELHQLTYLKCIIKETLRLHPSVPLLLPRENREPCQIKGYQIPANSRIVINAWAIGRDPRYWVDAMEFKPERFVDNYSIDNRGTSFEFIPFGGGRRMCPGIAFATPNMELPLAQLLYHFDWKLPNGIKNEELDMSQTLSLQESLLTIAKTLSLATMEIIGGTYERYAPWNY